MTKNLEKIYYFILLSLSFLAIWGSIVYLSFELNQTMRILVLLLSITSTILSVKLLKIKFSKDKLKEIKRNTKAPTFYYILYFLILFIISYLLIEAVSAEALISPWQVLNTRFFISYTALAIISLYGFYNKYQGHNLALIILYLISFSVALIVYKIGYGFDPFIHQASMEAIDKLGKIHPKNLYYNGYYSIVLIIHDILQVSIETVNKFIVPIISALSLPLALNIFIKHYFTKHRNTVISALVLMLPFSIFIISTPQNLAYLFLILSLVLGTTLKRKYIYLSGILSLASFFIHPLAGIPALIFWVLVFIHINRDKIKTWQYKTLLSLSSLASIISIPLAFVLMGQSSFNINFGTIEQFGLFWPSGESIWLNFSYFYGFNTFIFILILIFFGFSIWLKNYKNTPKIFMLTNILGLSFFLSYLLSQGLNFEYLIAYERDYYRERILIISIIFFLPMIIISFKYLLSKLNLTDKYFKISALLIIPLLFCASLYYSYPRHDNFYNSRGYSLSFQDIETVKFIEENNKNNNYIVLANQQVSLAALKTFGFKKYFKNNIFYYPIPTSGELYKYYLEMVYEGSSKDTIKKARELTGAKTVYFVINKYWWASTKIIDEASLIADEEYKLFDGDVYIFKYN
ncbi:MAG TPA: hypothetical protein VJ926_01145 [Patescibacteria group bacterium]|nr:hypothetical protein [Patescibacteria group bacterium]